MTDPETNDLLARYFSGDLDENAQARLLERCQRDPDALKEFARLTELERAIGWIHAEHDEETFTREVLARLEPDPASSADFVQTVVNRVQREPQAAVVADQIRQFWRWLLPGAAVATAAAAVLFWLSGGSLFHTDSAAGLQVEVLCLQSSSVIANGKPTEFRAAQKAKFNSLRVASGQARFRFEPGVEINVTGPAELRFVTPQRIHVDNGRLSADVGKNAHGFTVETQRAVVVDLGTRFGVDVATSGVTRVVVFEGTVEVHEPKAANGGSPRVLVARLTAGEEVMVDQPQNSHSPRFVVFRSNLKEWITQLSPPGSAVITDVRDSMMERSPERSYTIMVGGLKPGVQYEPDTQWLQPDDRSLPDWLDGADVVRTYATDRYLTDFFNMTVTLSRPASLFVLYDMSQPPPAWLRQRFANTGIRVRQSQTIKGEANPVTAWYAVWRSDISSAGPVKIGPPPVETEPGTPFGRMFIVAAKALPGADAPSQVR